MTIAPRSFSCRAPACPGCGLARILRGFTLTELLAVLAIMAVCTAMLPALSGSLQGSSLNSGTRATMNLLTAARTEAITRRELVRFAMAADWQDSAAPGYGKFSLWASATGDLGSWRQISRWEELPAGILFDPAASGYIDSASRPATDCLLTESTAPVFSAKVGANEVTMKYVEFTPGGAIRRAGGGGHEIWFALSTVRNASLPPSNWAVLAANIHTGRFRCVRPGG
jgi:prepilin-type N-terminal cleavage/methylation domain-containing protein